MTTTLDGTTYQHDSCNKRIEWFQSALADSRNEISNLKKQIKALEQLLESLKNE